MINVNRINHSIKYHNHNHNSKHKINLIVNADDFSYSQYRNAPIIQLIKKHSVSSISYIININRQNHYQNHHSDIKQLKQLSKNVNISIGLHLNLTQGYTASKKQIPYLTNNQCFKGKPAFYQIISSKQFVFPKQQIKLQIQSQIQAFIQILNIRPSHIDGHNHIHIIPQIAQILSQVMIKYGIYKTRVPIQPLTKQHPFNQIFINNAKIAQKIFSKNKIIYPEYFIGLELISNFNIEQIHKRILQIQKQINQKYKDQYKQVFVELMCHPGNCQPSHSQQFSRSINRQIQKNVLFSQQFQKVLNITGHLNSYNDLSIAISKNKIKKRVLIYSKMTNGTGNYTTSLRYKKILEQLGFDVYLRSIQSSCDYQEQVKSLRKFLYNFEINLILGVNISNSGKQIYEATLGTNDKTNRQILNRVPYILIIAGTDANITLKTQQQKQQNQLKKQKQLFLLQSIKNSLCMISMSQDMTEKIRKYLNHNKIQKDILTIEQSIQVQVVNQDYSTKVLKKYSVQYKKFIIFPTSFRKVKDINYILKQLNQIYEKYKIPTLLAGPILDKQYYQKQIDNLENVRYIETISKQQIIALIKQALILINTSQSQGMSCSIQQALSLKTLVVARDNKGNSNLIENSINGYLFKTPLQFIQIFQKKVLQNEQNQNQKLIQNGFLLVQQRFFYIIQKQKFKQTLNTYFFSKFQLIKINNIKRNQIYQLQIFNNQGIHPTSLINNLLYESMKQVMNQQKQSQNVLDLAAGSGIMGFIYLCVTQKKVKSITFSDYSKKILGSCLFNWINNKRILSKFVQEVNFIESNMFDQLNQNFFNTILACLPQSPFQKAQSRLDKNGGPDSTKYNFKLIKQWRNYTKKQRRLIMFYSWMCWPSKFYQLLEQQRLYIKWKSMKKQYKISKQAYEKMQQGLNEYLINHMREGKGQIEYNQIDEIFTVPAQMLLITSKDQLEDQIH